MFQKNDILVAKDKFVDKHETLQDTLGIVIDYNPDNDRLILGVVHPKKYAIPPTFSMRGEYYRHVTEDEKNAWNIAI